ncbi:MAG: 23S rRNA (pseudouridine(1915)-N(3))-methyltransferase RlmH [Bryobacteraceae bacterium]
MKVFVYYIGKRRDANANAIAADYVQRVSHYAACEMREIQPAKFDPWSRHPSASVILLDVAGKTLDSVRFSQLIRKAEDEARDVVFVIGGHDGLPEVWKSRPATLLSLSALTFPHELARAMLAEQIYRAFTILRGHPYPR